MRVGPLISNREQVILDLNGEELCRVHRKENETPAELYTRAKLLLYRLESRPIKEFRPLSKIYRQWFARNKQAMAYLRNPSDFNTNHSG